jgi:hypothetical protein
MPTRENHMAVQDMSMPSAPASNLQPPAALNTNSAFDNWKRSENEETVVPDANPFAGPGVRNWQHGEDQSGHPVQDNKSENGGAAEREGIVIFSRPIFASFCEAWCKCWSFFLDRCCLC